MGRSGQFSHPTAMPRSSFIFPPRLRSGILFFAAFRWLRRRACAQLAQCAFFFLSYVDRSRPQSRRGNAIEEKRILGERERSRARESEGLKERPCFFADRFFFDHSDRS